MIKSQKIAKSPEVVISFLESKTLFPPKRKVLSIFFLLFYAIFFSKQIKQNLTSVLSFFLLCTNKHKKRENEKWLPFYRFPFMYKHKKRKNEEWLPFYRFSLFKLTKTIDGKTEIDFPFIVFPFMYENTQKQTNGKRLPFYRFSLSVRPINERKNWI